MRYPLRMANLPKYSLSKDKKADDWVLRRDGATRATRRFDTKADATRAGVLSSALGKDGGSVRIKKENGRIQEERTYPRSRDPRRTKG